MDPLEILALDLIVILAAGFLSGALCRYFHFSTIVGYLIVGAIIGEGGLGFLHTESHDLQMLAEMGALFLLFSIGTEISWEELKHVGPWILIAGFIQLIAVSIPASLLFALIGIPWQGACLMGAAVALSSTVLVFRALHEQNVATSPAGIRSVGILLFQDMAIVPLMLAVPLLSATGEHSSYEFVRLGLVSLLFVTTIPVLAFVTHRFALPLFSLLRSRELLLLFALALLGGGCFVAHRLGLPAAFGAFGAGLILGGNRFTQQVDALTLPFRESFAAVFFISLGGLLNFALLLEDPLVVIIGFPLVLLVKTFGAGLALKLSGMNWRVALLMGLGLSQIGELSFLLLSEGMDSDLIDETNYNQMLVLAIGTMIITPGLIKFAVRKLGDHESLHTKKEEKPIEARESIREAVIIGVGPVARQVASRIETSGADVRFIDLNSVNTYPLIQAGFRAVTGDATKRSTLREAEIAHANLALVAVPDDEASVQIVKNIRSMNRHCTILARCRYQRNRERLHLVGADYVTDEESQTALMLIGMIEKLESSHSF
ncbi:sodium:proton exchanger [Bremerella cremea]|uniref:Sodium:proton exchanger n=1 Tax=Blastopirellula marina TaxID=124 RepID=A0A2S8FC06_9BACT|nr:MULTISPECIES: cation:proton antiporter [Pirellulaceae]PQO29474.1 sodium:proton exchanger [Blastopirellula marina]RCS42778.1 sodium:proton exchanger [Bremerella cremea]